MELIVRAVDEVVEEDSRDGKEDALTLLVEEEDALNRVDKSKPG